MNNWSDFGNTLRSTRESLGWSLQDVAHRTRIPLAVLRQLEANDYSGFPSVAYLKGFLAQYCDHLDLDASEQLDRFEQGDSLADLDSYEYLKDHDEHIDAHPLAMSRLSSKKKKKSKQPKEKIVPREPSGRALALQPLLVFSVTALLIAGAIFGFMELSDNLGQDEPVVEKQPAKTLAPLAGIPSPTPPISEVPDAPRAIPATSAENNLVAGTPSGTAGTETLNATPSTREVLPGDLAANPPPRAVIVEE